LREGSRLGGRESTPNGGQKASKKKKKNGLKKTEASNEGDLQRTREKKR